MTRLRPLRTSKGRGRMQQVVMLLPCFGLLAQRIPANVKDYALNILAQTLPICLIGPFSQEILKLDLCPSFNRHSNEQWNRIKLMPSATKI